MGILHRFARRRAAVIDVETRLMNRLGLAARPAAIQWIATSACDLACPHCYSNAGRRSRHELTLEEARKLVIDEMVKLGRPQLVIAGGEAPLRPDFEDIVCHAAHRRVPWALHTHGGSVLRRIEVFKSFPPAMVAVSLDGPREYHDAFRGRAGSFDRAVEAIGALGSAGAREVVAGTTVNRQNADLLVDLMPDVLASGIRSTSRSAF